ncbi:MAG: hypothetical protein QGI78_05475 [Phycisphaerales bacterium]|nr:hypothetical protein [Phycisphaerales bacterium]
MKTIQKLTLTCMTAVATTSLVQTTHAQMEFMAEAMHPEYFSRDLVVFSEGLDLDDTQEVIVEAMFDSYNDDFEAGWAATTERLNTVADQLKEDRPASETDTLKPVLETLGSWLEEKRALDQGLLENVKTILVDEQLEIWPLFEQRLYREKHMNRGRMNGESTDLYQVTRDTNLSGTAEATITPHLEEYAVGLDIAMRKRDAILRGNPKKLFDNILAGDTSQSPEHVEALVKARIEVRDINDRYIEVISSSLNAVDGEDFRTRALNRGYPRIFRKTPAQRIIRQAAENDTYDPEIRALILQLEAAYLGELILINYELLDLTRRHDPEIQRNRALAGQVRKTGATPDRLEDPTRPLYKDREALGKRYIEMLRDILSPDAFMKLEGSRRWIPRDEQSYGQPTAPTKPPVGPDGGLSLQDKPTKPKGKGSGKGTQPEPKPNPSGFGNSKGDRGSRN